MDKFWVVTLFHFQPTENDRTILEGTAVEEFKALGIEEFSLTEAEVDAILGERAYSGGDIPESVLDEVESTVLGRPANYRYFFGTMADAENFKSHCQKQVLAEIQVEEHEEQDWNAEWKKHYAPILVNNKFEIIPSWMTDYQSKAAQKIYIYPGMGFGTGSHETTFLCLKLLTEELDFPLKSVLDFGSGSGILGLATFKFFPEAQVDFYDIDPEANKNCYQNAEINQLEKMSFRLLLPEVREKLKPQYDLVFANILESILMLEINYLIQVTRPGGALILSGLLKPQVDGIIQAYTAGGMTLKRKLEKGDWAALYFTKEPA
ncbi:MAG: 50S ribosomal protein L11 methyltransferase [Bdellovibrionales bacterium]|nr:50S ribosomal protein L11 methyltransferase [Bdellovibrionales bacterium]